jgi:hypothetical protein
MKNDKTTIKITATKSQANEWAKRSKSLGIPRADYLSSLLTHRESFPFQGKSFSCSKRS